MTKSASGNSATEQSSRDKYHFITTFLIIQAVLLICLAIYFYEPLSLEALAALIFWATTSLALATLHLRQRFISASAPLPQPAGESNDTYIFGVPNHMLDLASLCYLVQEGVALLRNGQIIYVNPALSYILAAQEEEILGTRINSYVHPEDASLISLDGSIPTGSGPSHATLRLTTRLGDVRWVICSVHQVEWHEREATLLLFENIGPLKQAQQTQEEQEQRSRILLERTPLGIAMFDAMGQLKLANTAWHSLWSSIVGSGGRRRFNIMQDPFLPNTTVEKAIRQAFNKKDSGVSNFEHAAPWGETRWLNLNFHPMTGPMGQLIGVAMIQQDITEQVRSARRENELNDQLTTLRHEISYSQTFIAQMHDQARHVLINFEPDGTISAWNTCAERRFGLPKNLALGRNYKHLETDFSPYVPILQKALSSGEPQNVKCQTRLDKNGPHYENVLVYMLNMSFKPVIFLEIKDISHHVFSNMMEGILNRYGALSAMGNVFADVLDFSSTPPFLRKRPGAVERLLEFCDSIKFLASRAKPEANIQPVQLGNLLESLLEKIGKSSGDGLVFQVELEEPSPEILADPELLPVGFEQLSKILLSMEHTDDEKWLRLTQSTDERYAIVNMAANTVDASRLMDFAALLAELENQLPGFAANPRLKALLDPLQGIYACGGILGAYSNEQESGFVCRFLLHGQDKNPIIQ